MAIGAAERPSPYKLLWINPREINGLEAGSQTVIGSVYTPFLRLAMWAYQGREAGYDVDRAAIPAGLLDPVLLVAIQGEPSCCPPIAVGQPVWHRAALLKVEEVPRGGSCAMLCAHQIGVPALWEDVDLSYLRHFDSETAARTSFLAAFPLKDVRAGLRLAFEHHFREASGIRVLHFSGYGRISERDIRSWR